MPMPTVSTCLLQTLLLQMGEHILQIYLCSFPHFSQMDVIHLTEFIPGNWQRIFTIIVELGKLQNILEILVAYPVCPCWSFFSFASSLWKTLSQLSACFLVIQHFQKHYNLKVLVILWSKILKTRSRQPRSQHRSEKGSWSPTPFWEAIINYGFWGRDSLFSVTRAMRDCLCSCRWSYTRGHTGNANGYGEYLKRKWAHEDGREK